MRSKRRPTATIVAPAFRNDASTIGFRAGVTVTTTTCVVVDEPSDTATKISVAKIERVAQLTYLAAAEMASGAFTPKPLTVPDGPWTPIAPKSRRGGGK